MSNPMQDLHTLGINPFAVTLLAESMLKSAYVNHCGTKPLTFEFPVNRPDCKGWAGVCITIEAVPAAGQVVGDSSGQVLPPISIEERTAAGMVADAPAEQWPRDLSEAEMDELATALNEHDAGSIGFHGLVDRVLAVVRRTDGVTAAVKESLTAGAPEPQASEHCTWMQDGEADGTWFTDCGHAFNLEAGAPAENKMKFCCYCGKPMRAPGVSAAAPSVPPSEKT